MAIVRLLCLTAVVLIPSSGHVPRAQGVVPAWQAAALAGIEHTLNEDFDIAFALYDSLEKAHPERPEGALGQAMVLYNKGLLLKTDDALRKQTLRHLDRGIDLGEDLVDDHGETPELFFWLGSAHALKASLYVYGGDMIDAVMSGLRAREFLKAAVEEDPGYTDAHFGLAFTEYMAARQPRFLKYVSRLFNLSSGDRVGSLAQIDRVARDGIYTRSIARTTRAYLELYFERRPMLALEMFRHLRQIYPGSIDYGVRELDCMLALTITGVANYAPVLADSAASIEATAAKRRLVLDDWMRTKLYFVNGYGHYLGGHYEQAKLRMEAYLAESHRKSWIKGPSHLVLAKMADLAGDRRDALKHYEEVLDAENVWDTHQEAQKYLEEPFTGEEVKTRSMDTETRYPQNP